LAEKHKHKEKKRKLGLNEELDKFKKEEETEK